MRFLVYPQFARRAGRAFAAYERSHQRLVTRVVGPLFAGQGVTTLLLLALRPEAVPLLPVLAGAACLAAVLGVTAFLAVPLHRRLDAAGTPRRTGGCCASTGCGWPPPPPARPPRSGRCSPPARRVTLVAVGRAG